MNKFFLLLVSYVCFINPIFSQDNSENKQDYSPFLLGVSYVPSNSWGFYSIIGQKQYLKYDFDATSMTTWEGTISGKRLPFKLGINLQFENNLVGKLYKYSGYLGFKRTFIRIQTGKLSGTSDWTGGAIPNYTSNFPFSSRYTNIDMLMYVKKFLATTSFIGLGYTSLRIPIQVNTLKTATDQAHQEYAVPVFDKDFSIKAYSFLFGFDLIQSEAILKKSPIGTGTKPGFGFFATTQDRFGLGMCKLTSEAISKAEEVNSGLKSVGGNLFSALVEYQGSMGLKWSTDIGKARLILGVGYEVSGAMVANFSGAAKKSTDLGFDPSLFYYRHGVILRAFFSW